MLHGPSKDAPLPGVKRIAITGAAGSVGCALLSRIASGEVFGAGTSLELSLIEAPGAGMDALAGVVMELDDCAFPLLRAVWTTDSPSDGLCDADVAVLIGGSRQGQGMVRADLLQSNAQIFADQGRALGETARRDVQVVVVANPVNTNALILAEHAPDLDPDQFTALTRIDQNRAISQVAAKTGALIGDVERLVVWGNHSASMHPDLSHALVSGRPALSVIDDPVWVHSNFTPTVQTRAEDITRVRGKSSAFSAASAAVDHLRDMFGSPKNSWRTMAVRSDGSYGIDEGFWFSVPCVCGDGAYRRVLDLPEPDEALSAVFSKNCKELRDELQVAKEILQSM
jgi:malate dehydrogenase